MRAPSLRAFDALFRPSPSLLLVAQLTLTPSNPSHISAVPFPPHALQLRTRSRPITTLLLSTQRKQVSPKHPPEYPFLQIQIPFLANNNPSVHTPLHPQIISRPSLTPSIVQTFHHSSPSLVSKGHFNLSAVTCTPLVHQGCQGYQGCSFSRRVSVRTNHSTAQFRSYSLRTRQKAFHSGLCGYTKRTPKAMEAQNQRKQDDSEACDDRERQQSDDRDKQHGGECQNLDTSGEFGHIIPGSDLVTQIHETSFQVTPLLEESGALGMHPRREDMTLIILNFDLPPFTHLLWQQAGGLRVCADGGADRLFNHIPLVYPEEDPNVARSRFIPDVIIGDLDSITPKVQEFYESKGSKVINLCHDQDSTDLHKCVQHILDHSSSCQEASSIDASGNRTSGMTDVSQMELVVVGGLGGRIDHEFGNINVMHRFNHVRIILLSSYCLLTLLPSGRCHVIRPNVSFEGPHCGLIPVYQPSTSTTTTGLRWNLENLSMSFGTLVSTSNQLASNQVTVESDVPLLWTTEIRLP